MTTTGETLPEQGRPAARLSRRGAERRREIVDAAVRVIAGQGLSGLSMRSVAAEAGMPLGALDYYFDDKFDLVFQSFRLLSELEIDRVVGVATRLQPTMEARQLADLLADMTLTGLSQTRGTIIARHELVVESSRDDRLIPLFQAWYAAMVPALGRLFRALGSREPETDARLVLAVLAGLEADNIFRPLRPSDKRAIRAVLRRLFVALDRVRADA